MSVPLDMADPAARQQALAAISPQQAAQHHELLRDIFAAEVHYRRGEGRLEYYENLYWCAYLLFCVGDPSDVPAMWVAKHTNVDTATGFDTHAMFGAGVPETLSYLRVQGHGDVAAELEKFPSAELDGWSGSTRTYFYS